MRLAIATLHSGDFPDLAAITDRNHQEYATCHGYEYLKLKPNITDPAGIGYYRLLAFMEALGDATEDAILFCGVDTIFTNFTLPLPLRFIEKKPVAMCRDAKMIQSDVMLVRNDAYGIGFLRAVWNDRDDYGPPLYEQTAMEQVILEAPNYVNIVPQWQLQSYDYREYPGHHYGMEYETGLDRGGNRGQWEGGDYMLHVPGKPIEQKIAIINRHLPLIRK